MANSSSDATPVSGASPSRRQFFQTAGIAAGGLYALAAPSLAGPWVAQAEAAVDKRSYVVGRFGLELDGAFCGLISAFQGGNIVAEVITTRQGQGFPTKHLGPLKVEPITIEVGLEMTKPLYEWMSRTLNLENARKNGAIIEMDQSFKEVGRRSFTNAFISEIEFPACDASSKTPANITVTIAPETLKLEGGSGKQAPSGGAKTQKSILASNYRFNIQGLEQATQRATKIEAFGFKQSIVAQQGGQSRVSSEKSSGQPEFTNLVVLVSEASAGPMYAWFDDFVIKGNNSAAKERPGVLEFLSGDMKNSIANVQFSGLGVFKISSDSSAGAERQRLTKVEMYCQRMTFNP